MLICPFVLPLRTWPDAAFIFSTAAIDATKMAGCETAVVSSFSFGPLTHTSSRSYPRISDALSKSSLAAGTSSVTSLHMPTYCAPWPGKQKATLCENPSKSESIDMRRVAARGARCATRSAAERDVMNAVAEVVNIASVSRSLEVCMLEAYVGVERDSSRWRECGKAAWIVIKSHARDQRAIWSAVVATAIAALLGLLLLA
mmetsp:Transcript_107308/g.311777  ORF Transcript_107308/g.311777 Transcript_107308/m.311777 type:complete len:201 (-) Transcript_107308:35-637(-)